MQQTQQGAHGRRPRPSRLLPKLLVHWQHAHVQHVRVGDEQLGLAPDCLTARGDGRKVWGRKERVGGPTWLHGLSATMLIKGRSKPTLLPGQS